MFFLSKPQINEAELIQSALGASLDGLHFLKALDGRIYQQGNTAYSMDASDAVAAWVNPFAMQLKPMLSINVQRSATYAAKPVSGTPTITPPMVAVPTVIDAFVKHAPEFMNTLEAEVAQYIKNQRDQLNGYVALLKVAQASQKNHDFKGYHAAIMQLHGQKLIDVNDTTINYAQAVSNLQNILAIAKEYKSFEKQHNKWGGAQYEDAHLLVESIAPIATSRAMKAFAKQLRSQTKSAKVKIYSGLLPLMVRYSY